MIELCRDIPRERKSETEIKRVCEKERQTDREYDGERQKGRERKRDGRIKKRETYIQTERDKHIHKEREAKPQTGSEKDVVKEGGK